jgi:hypothetical protein
MITNNFHAEFTNDIHRVYESLLKEGVVVYKLDRLTQITDVEMNYKEIVKEMTDE